MHRNWINDIHSFIVYFSVFFFLLVIYTVKWSFTQFHRRWIQSRFEWLDSTFCICFSMIKTVNLVVFPILSILVKYCILTDVWFLGEVEYFIIFFVFLYFVHSSHLAYIIRKKTRTQFFLYAKKSIAWMWTWWN